MRPSHVFLLALLFSSCEPSKKETQMLTKVLWEQSNGSHKNYRIPALIVSKQNTILAFAEGRESGDAGNIDILLKRSKDNGNTWEDQIIVWDDAANTCGNPTPVIDQETGRIILFMTWNLGTDHEADIIRKKSESTRSPFMTYSDDDGLTWSKPKNLFESAKNPDWGWYATGPGVGIQLKSKKYEGRLIIPCNNSYDDPTITKRDGFGYGAHVLISDNAGLNWRLSESINPEVNESQVVELTDGSLIMNMRSYQGKSSRAISQSYDGGETWSAVTHDAALIDPVCQASFIAFGEFNKAPLFLFSNPASTNKRTNMTIKGSFDEAQTWANSRSIYEGPAAYSSLTKLPNGNIGLFFEAGENNPYEKMVFLSISPDELFDPQNSAQSVIGASLPIAIGWE